MFSLAERAFALRLGVTLDPIPHPCWGYQNCCDCDECIARAEQPAPPPVAPQPWELRSAA